MAGARRSGTQRSHWPARMFHANALASSELQSSCLFGGRLFSAVVVDSSHLCFVLIVQKPDTGRSTHVDMCNGNMQTALQVWGTQSTGVDPMPDLTSILHFHKSPRPYQSSRLIIRGTISQTSPQYHQASARAVKTSRKAASFPGKPAFAFPAQVPVGDCHFGSKSTLGDRKM